MVKGKGRTLKSVISDNLLSGLHPANDDNIASHLQFMDDTLLLIVALMCEVWCLKSLLNAFLEAFNLSINNDKSELSFFNALIRL